MAMNFTYGPRAPAELRGYFMRHKHGSDVGFSWDKNDPSFSDQWERIPVIPETTTTPPSPSTAPTDEAGELLQALDAKDSLMNKIRKAGLPPHSDYWHQSIDEANERISKARAALASRPVVEAALCDGYQGSTVTSDFHGPKITLRYATTAQADAAHEIICAKIDGAHTALAAKPAKDAE